MKSFTLLLMDNQSMLSLLIPQNISTQVSFNEIHQLLNDQGISRHSVVGIQ